VVFPVSDLLLGTCGWSYAEWEGILYSARQGKLKQYCSIFPTAEIDSTFYAIPKEGTILGWARQTPPGFVFSAKLPQTITHKKVIDTSRGVEAHVKQFLEAMKPLTEADKLACVLVQLQGFLRFNSERLETFLSTLPDKPSFAVEFRHGSWLREETFKILTAHHVAYVIVDEPLLPPEPHVTSDIAYLRWHGRGDRPWFNYKYSQQELEEWVPRVNEVAGKAQKVLGYFNNHFHGYAPENCLQISEMLGVANPHGSGALRRLKLRGTEREAAAKPKGLEVWTGPIVEKGVESLLLNFVDPETLAEARMIPEKDLSLREDSKRHLAAYVGDTTVDVDFEQHTIIHRCPLWTSLVAEKKFCPHVARVFLMTNPERARLLLASIHSNLSDWEFESKLAVEFTSRSLQERM
jgi:uncharacterized protein YecE (DUF72 family)